jgi:PAS domain S-box-containing protein
VFDDVLTVKTRYAVDYRLVLADGSIKHIHSVGHPILDASGALVERFGTVVDVTERKRAEQELRESEEQWRDVFENNPTMYFMVDAGGTIMAVNPYGAEHLGYGVDELVGRPVVSVLYESDRDAVQGHVAICFKHLGMTHSWEARKVRRDGEVLWVRETGKAVQRANGAIVLMACEDITERKQVEVEKDRLEAQLRQSQKMEAMGTLAGGIAHDFNNILGAILGYGELAQQAVAEGSEVRRYVDNVMQAGGRAKSLVDRILAFSRSGVSELSPINVQAIIEETLELLAATSLTPDVRLEKHLHADAAAIVGDATQLHQVAMNLFTNALQAMESSGTLRVTLDREEVSQDLRLLHGTLPAGNYLRLSVSDTGSGIPAARAGKDVRPILHHERRRQGNRSRSVVGTWHRGGSRGRDRRPHGHRFRDYFHGLAATHRRSGRVHRATLRLTCRTAAARSYSSSTTKSRWLPSPKRRLPASDMNPSDSAPASSHSRLSAKLHSASMPSSRMTRCRSSPASISPGKSRNCGPMCRLF